MGRRRKTDKHLPARVYKPARSRSYYFVDAGNTWHSLGPDYFEAMRRYAEINQTGTGDTLGAVMDRYQREIIPTKAPRTQKDNLVEIQKLRSVFGHMRPDQVTPPDIYQYLDLRPPVRGRRERALLSHIYTKAIRWAKATSNPCRLMRLDAIPRRDRYVSDGEFLAVRGLASPAIRCAMDLAFLTALRKGDLLALTWRQVSDDGIRVQTGKTGRRVLIEYSDELRQVLEACKSLPSDVSSFYILHRKNGQPYTESGFNSVWQRLQGKYQVQGGERFRWHDIRRKAATDADALHGREFARKLLSHDDQKTTAGYIAGEQRTRPTR